MLLGKKYKVVQGVLEAVNHFTVAFTVRMVKSTTNLMSVLNHEEQRQALPLDCEPVRKLGKFM